MENDIRQVIVVRKDLLNPLDKYIGKMMAQCGHASTNNILNLMGKVEDDKSITYTLKLNKDSDVYQWINGLYKKIVVYVDNEEQLIKVYKKAVKKGLNAVLIQDSGLTAYIPGTYTTCAIGPAPHKSFNGITNHLSIKFEGRNNYV